MAHVDPVNLLLLFGALGLVQLVDRLPQGLGARSPIFYEYCEPLLLAAPATLLDSMKNLIGRDAHSLPYPLNICRWELQTLDHYGALLTATVECHESSPSRGFWKPHKPRISITWKIHGNRVIIEWSMVATKTLFQLTGVPKCAEPIIRLVKSSTQNKISELNSMVSPKAAGTVYSGGSLASGLSGRRSNAGRPTGTSANAASSRQAQPAFGKKADFSPSRKLAWPTPQDYHEIIQNPRAAFVDPELRNGTPELDFLGMPKVATGAFASVYRLHCGGRDFAVRCFLNPVKDQQYRYEQLSKYICSDDLSYTVNFEFLKDGIIVNGIPYPILKMEWVEGTPINFYAEKLLQNGESLASLLQRFRVMTQALYDAGIAHGDMQHGNILVRDHELVLVDYDGMFVPSLSMDTSNELGHPNYQHPSRQASHFGPYLDNFSAHLIDTSLSALIAEPELWSRLGAGDECLLFRRSDLLNPNDSKTFHILLHQSDANVRERAEHLKSLLKKDLREIPALGSDGANLAPRKTLQVESSGMSTNDTSSHNDAAARPNLPDWLSG